MHTARGRDIRVQDINTHRLVQTTIQIRLWQRADQCARDWLRGLVTAPDSVEIKEDVLVEIGNSCMYEYDYHIAVAIKPCVVCACDRLRGLVTAPYSASIEEDGSIAIGISCVKYDYPIDIAY